MKDYLVLIGAVVLTVILLLCGGVAIQHIVASVISFLGFGMVLFTFKDVKDWYKDWMTWVKVILVFIATILVGFGFCYTSFWTILSGVIALGLAVIVRAIEYAINKKKNEAVE